VLGDLGRQVVEVRITRHLRLVLAHVGIVAE
jgi:hypothetical protein